MAVITITPANLEMASSKRPVVYQALEAITAGAAVYQDATTAKVGLADNTTLAKAACIGIALTNCNLLDDYIVVAGAESEILIGGTLVPNEFYVVGAAGALQLESDNISTEYGSYAFLASSTTTGTVKIINTGVQTP